jgi:hypothetical protein
MSRINGEKARASIATRNRNARREKDRARLAQLRQEAAARPAAPKSEEKPAAKPAKKAAAKPAEKAPEQTADKPAAAEKPAKPKKASPKKSDA